MSADQAGAVLRALTDLVSSIPNSVERPARYPGVRSGKLIRKARRKAAAVSGVLALPPGPFGLITILPDLVAIWRIQRRLVADLAAVHGKSAMLTRELMLYCLFRHSSSQLVRDLAARVGGRVLIKRATQRFFQQTLQKIGLRLTRRLLGKAISRWFPFVGAGVMAVYAWRDTDGVGKSALELFSTELMRSEELLDQWDAADEIKTNE